MTVSAPPAGLSGAGSALWEDVTASFALRADERRVLEAAAREADLIAVLDAGLVDADLMVRGSQGQQVINPLISEVRQHRATMARLLAQLHLPDEDSGEGAGVGPQARSSSARALANARWSKRGA